MGKAILEALVYESIYLLAENRCMSIGTIGR